nr:HAD-IC family P-type ATPase [Limnoglobus roseus]
MDAPATGLTSAEARDRLARHGPNQPAPDHGPTPVLELLALFTNPLSVILLAAAGVTVWVGDSTGAAVIVVIVVAGAAINFFQTYRSARAVRRLREGVAVTATILRDGQWQELPRADVVPGDVVRLSAGDLVPADGRLLAARDLHVQQAVLTGESLPVEKMVGDPASAAAIRPYAADAVFYGTSVVGGTGTAVVVATGPATAFGEIAARLAGRPPETEFDRGTRRFGLFITQTVIGLVFFVLLTNLLLHRDPLESLLFAVALAVGMTPEFLPMITAVTLAAGARRMARQKVVVKHLAAMQNLGSMDVLCSDKTGTLTRGEMTLTVVVDPAGTPAERPFELAYVNSANETGIRSPLDAAILARRAVDTIAFRKVDEIPFDFERRRLSVAVDGPAGRQLITKGSPEGVLACCIHAEIDDRVVVLDAAVHDQVKCVCDTLGGQGYRLLAVAVKTSAQPAFRVADEAGLTLVGLLGFVDPPRTDAAEVLRALQADGVAVKVLSGDSDLVARHVCEQVGLTGRLVLGDEIDRLDATALGAVAEEAVIFARLNPGQKTRVLAALKARGHVVGFLGDGVNDAPSLRAADVGVTVSTAADVAKDAAEVVLLEPGLGGAARRHSGGPAGLRERDEVPVHGDQFQLREHAQHGRRGRLPPVPADAAEATATEQLPVRRCPTAHSDRPGGPGVRPQAAAVGRAADPPVHARGRAGQLAVRPAHFCCAPPSLPRGRCPVPHRLVRGIAGHPGARAVRHPHVGPSLGKPAESRVDRRDRGGGRARVRPPVHGRVRAARIRPPPARVPAVRGECHGGVPGGGRMGQADRLREVMLTGDVIYQSRV